MLILKIFQERNFQLQLAKHEITKKERLENRIEE
jgi:hypothetical protein